MNGKIHIDLEVAKLLYYKYKDVLFPIVVILISFFIFLEYGIPQIQNFLSTSSQVQANEETLAIMTQNYNTIAQLQDADIANLTSIANRALPTQKDYAEILNDISLVVAKTGVSLSDYSFSLGDITGSAGGPNDSGTVQISLNITGTVDQMKNFLTLLYQQFPLSDVSDVSLGNGTTTVPIQFFYSPLSTPRFVDTSPIPVLSTTQRKFLLDLAEKAGENSVQPSPILSQAPVSSNEAR